MPVSFSYYLNITVVTYRGTLQCKMLSLYELSILPLELDQAYSLP